MNPKGSNKGIKLGLLFLGRKRPGFDMDWGASMEIKVRNVVNGSGFEVFEPSKKAVDDNSLREVVAECEEAGVEALALLQTTMADGRMAPAPGPNLAHPPVFWATPEKQEGDMISSCSLVGAHLWASSFRQMGRSFVVNGDPEDSTTLDNLDVSVRSVAIIRKLRSRVGVIEAVGFANGADPFSCA